MFTKNYQLQWIADRANIHSKYITHKFFNFGCGFYVSFPILLPQTGDVNIFAIRDVFSSGYVQLKGSFSDEKYISGEIWGTL